MLEFSYYRNSQINGISFITHRIRLKFLLRNKTRNYAYAPMKGTKGVNLLLHQRISEGLKLMLALLKIQSVFPGDKKYE